MGYILITCTAFIIFVRMKEACSHLADEVHTDGCHDLSLCDKGFKARHYSAKEKTLHQYKINFFGLKFLTKLNFVIFITHCHGNNQRWPPNKISSSKFA